MRTSNKNIEIYQEIRDLVKADKTSTQLKKWFNQTKRYAALWKAIYRNCNIELQPINIKTNEGNKTFYACRIEHKETKMKVDFEITGIEYKTLLNK